VALVLRYLTSGSRISRRSCYIRHPDESCVATRIISHDVEDWNRALFTVYEFIGMRTPKNPCDGKQGLTTVEGCQVLHWAAENEGVRIVPDDKASQPLRRLSTCDDSSSHGCG
jgi:hypothetical protein